MIPSIRMIQTITRASSRYLRSSTTRRISTATFSPSISVISAGESRWNRNSNLNICNIQSRQFSSKDTTVDYFKLFGLDKSQFTIDPKQMKHTYLKLMNEHHPDKLIHSSSDNDSEITAETITHAYQILTKPHTRALHWLELHGCELGEARMDESSFANPQELVGMEFLMEIMEWREAIEDAMDSPPKLEQIAQETSVLHRLCVQNLEELLESSSTPDDATLQDAKQLTAQLQYWHRLEATLKDAMDVE